MIPWLIARLFKMERGLRHSPLLHPFLAGFYPILGLFSLNADQLWPGMLIEPLLASAVISVLLLGIARWGLGRWERAGFMVSILWALFYGLGYVDDLLRLGGLNGPWVLRFGVILPAVFLSAAAWWWLRRRGEMRDPTLFANIAVLVLLLFPLVRIGAKLTAGERRSAEESVASVAAAPAGPRRDVYYIILDGYARGDVLKELFGYDNGPFLKALEKRGFRVLPSSRSNYAFTALSLASSLNMEYLDGLAAREGKESVSFQVCKEMIQDSRLQSFFKERGYTTIHFKTGWAINDDNPRADVQVGGAGLIEFDAILLRSSAIGVFMEARLENDYRELILNNLTTLGLVARRPGPKYVFAHFVSPHAPYVFDRHGRHPQEDYGKATYRDRWSKRTRYADQLHYLSGRILQAIDQIQARSTIPPIIVIQSDHGSASLGFWRRPPPAVAFERMSDFCALSLPGFHGDIPADITNVNTFRLVLDAYFGTRLGQLPNRCYYSVYSHPYDWVEVTDVFRSPPVLTDFKPTPEELHRQRLEVGQ